MPAFSLMVDVTVLISDDVVVTVGLIVRSDEPGVVTAETPLPAPKSEHPANPISV